MWLWSEFACKAASITCINNNNHHHWNVFSKRCKSKFKSLGNLSTLTKQTYYSPQFSSSTCNANRLSCLKLKALALLANKQRLTRNGHKALELAFSYDRSKQQEYKCTPNKLGVVMTERRGTNFEIFQIISWKACLSLFYLF